MDTGRLLQMLTSQGLLGGMGQMSDRDVNQVSGTVEQPGTAGNPYNRLAGLLGLGGGSGQGMGLIHLLSQLGQQQRPGVGPGGPPPVPPGAAPPAMTGMAPRGY